MDLREGMRLLNMNLQSRIQLRTGNSMPIIGLGTWQLTKDTAEIIEEALALGYPMIDTSGDYGTQPGIGQGIKQSTVERDSFYLISKVEEDDDAYAATRKNLEELQQNYVDLMLIHRPPRNGAGIQLWKGLIRAQQDGLTKDIGVSNYSIELIEDLIGATGVVPVANQIEWSPFGHSKEMLRYAEKNDIVIQAYSPLTRTERLDDSNIQEIAERHEKTPAQIFIRWNLQLGTVPLPKANQKEHLHEDIDVFDFELSDEEMTALDALNEHYSCLGRELSYV